jgi:Druantia protein DruA
MHSGTQMSSKMSISKDELREKIITNIKKQGFIINPHLRPQNYSKEVIRKIHSAKRRELLEKHSKFLDKNLEKVTSYLKNGDEINPNKISLELREVKDSNQFESKIFFWWNLVWWSLPYTKPIGRQMRFVLWDTYHDSPFGLLGLQSPPLRSTVRDNYLGLSKGDTKWINQSLYGQRIGALPPYNDLIGSKMVVLSMVSNEIRQRYKEKYENKKTLMNKKILPPELLFFTTTGAFGKSSVYERVKYQNRNITKFIGYTTGRGTFHIPQSIYEEMLEYLNSLGINVERGFGTGPSRKLYLIKKATSKLGLTNYIFHNIKRSYYLIPNIANLDGVLHKKASPNYYNYTFEDISQYWKERWCIPRSERMNKWKLFTKNQFIENVVNEIKTIEN